MSSEDRNRKRNLLTVKVCNIKKVKKDFGWEPQVGVKDGVRKLAAWVKENKGLFN